MENQKEITKEDFRETANSAVLEFCSGRSRNFLSMRLKGQFSWPDKFTRIRLLERDWLLWPNTKWDKPGIIIHCPSGDGKEEAKLAMRFLSALSWVQKKAIEDEGFWLVGTNVNPCFRDEPLPDPPFPIGRGFMIDENDYLPFPNNEKAQVALALYREAMCLNEESYQFLSYYKILNVKFEKSLEQKAWINENLKLITDHSATKEIQKLSLKHSDIGHYLFVSGRCAVAHAWGDPIVNPDNPEDKRRLSSELPIIRALSELMIEKEFGIKSSTTIYREHFYELAGFSEVLGADLVESIVEDYDFDADGEQISSLVERKLPTISIRLRGEPELPFEQLNLEVLEYSAGRMLIRGISYNGLIEAYLALNFKEKRLEFDPVGGFISWDNGSAGAAHSASLVNLFIGKLFANGVLEVWTENKLLGRIDPFIPTNIDLTGTVKNYRQTARNMELLCVMRTIGVPKRKRQRTSPKKLMRSTCISSTHLVH